MSTRVETPVTQVYVRLMCCGESMRWDGLTRTSFPPQFLHVCATCLKTEKSFSAPYPRFEYRTDESSGGLQMKNIVAGGDVIGLKLT